MSHAPAPETPVVSVGPVPRFGLRTLFVMITTCAMGLAVVMQSSSTGLRIFGGAIPACWLGWMVYVVASMLPRNVSLLLRIPRELGQFVGVSVMLLAFEAGLIGLLILLTELVSWGVLG